MIASMAAAQDTPGDAAGKWSITIHATDAPLNEQWNLKQDGNKITGTAKTTDMELPFTAKIEGKVLKGNIKDGDMYYEVNMTVVNNDMDGTIKMGKHLFLVSGKRKS